MKLAVMGAAGRMGRALVQAVVSSPGVSVAGGTEPAGSAAVGTDIGTLAGLDPLGVSITDKPLEIFTKLDGILDFTVPKATVEFAAFAAQARIVHVIGTTGLSDEDEEKITAAARHATIVKAGNMSIGVNLLTALTARVARALDEDFDIEIVEMHHRHKVDAPSGTALMLGQAAAEGRSITLDRHAVRTRDGHTGPRHSGDIGFATLRGGSVIGEHSVIFAGEGERIELTHRAQDRSIFARGGVKAAIWGQDKPPGLYSMIDVLGL
ncbi:MAG: 4-hydroxy-tetrahydrodipicolinate reductase [Methyloligellaceae bacterium]